MAKLRVWSSFLEVLAFAARNWQTLTALAVGVVSAWIAGATDFLEPYAPYSYFVAFLLGAILIMSLLCLGAWFAEKISKRNYWNHMSRTTPFVNPLRSTFNGERISLEQIADPSTREILHKTFVECQIVGRRLTFIYLGCNFHAPIKMNDCDLFSVPGEEGESVPPSSNIYLVKHCIFNECTFYYQTMLFVQRDAQMMIERGVTEKEYWFLPPPESQSNGDG